MPFVGVPIAVNSKSAPTLPKINGSKDPTRIGARIVSLTAKPSEVVEVVLVVVVTVSVPPVAAAAVIIT